MTGPAIIDPASQPPLTARAQGIMQGYPPAPDKIPGPTNWDLPPFNR